MDVGWFSEMMSTFGTIFPRIVQVDYTERGVLFTRGKYRELEPGIHLYWPVWSFVEALSVKHKTLDLSQQTLTTKDDRKVVVSATISFVVDDTIKALVETEDFESSLLNAAQKGVKDTVQSSSYEDLLGKMEETESTLHGAIQNSVDRFGITVEEAFFADLSEAVVLRVVT